MSAPILARRTDPAGSHFAAAAMMDSEGQRTECAEILSLLKSSHDALSYRELHRLLRGRISEPVEVMRRLDDLRKAGEVKASGSKVRRCSISGRAVQVWEAA